MSAAHDSQPSAEQPRESGSRGLTRRRFLTLLGGASIAGGASYLVARGLAFRPTSPTGGTTVPPTSPGPSPPRGGEHRLDEFADNIRSGGPPKDGIPPIDEPKFVSAAEARFLSDGDVVFGLARAGEARAYPQLVLVWHEIVNDRFPDGPLSVTYCPLTGSVVAFRSATPEGEPYTFGTSGDLVNSNLLMYDRQTDSRWPQILGVAINGPSRGRRLEEIPMIWTTWRRWRAVHPNTAVLSTETGYARSYGTDPYGSYNPLGGYYRPESRLFFPVMHEDDRLARKEVVVGVKHGAGRLAVHKDLLRRDGVVDVALGGDAVAVLHDSALDEGRAYVPRVDGREVRLSRTEEPGRYRDEASGTVWNAAGEAVSGARSADLEPVVAFDCMWFAWVAFFPQTGVVA